MGPQADEEEHRLVSNFKDIGRIVLEAQITASLGQAAERFDIVGLVNGFVEEFGFIDLDESDRARYLALLARHDRTRSIPPTN